MTNLQQRIEAVRRLQQATVFANSSDGDAARKVWTLAVALRKLNLEISYLVGPLKRKYAQYGDQSAALMLELLRQMVVPMNKIVEAAVDLEDAIDEADMK